MPFARGDMRDHIVLHKNDHGASYLRYGVLPAKNQLLRDFRRRSIFDFSNTIPSPVKNSEAIDPSL